MTDTSKKWIEIKEINKDYRSFECKQIDSRCENNICSIHITLLDQIRREENVKARGDERNKYVLQLKSFLAHLSAYSCNSKHPHRKLKSRINLAIKRLEQPLENKEERK